jgi:plastocyanin
MSSACDVASLATTGVPHAIASTIGTQNPSPCDGANSTSIAVYAAAIISGRVQLPAARTAPVMNQRYEIVSRAGILATNPPLAVVYLEGDFPAPTTPATVKLPQKDFAFVPALLAIRAGTRVEFPNLDDTYHNIFSYSPAKRFDLGRYRPDETPVPVQVFDTPGLITLRCDIHEHMRGVILVLDTPHFVMTDAAGNFRLTGLPAGRYMLKVWLDSRITLERPVDLAATTALRVDFPARP